MGKLILTRARGFYASLEHFQIVVDGQRLASIKNGYTAVIELPAGHHEVIARSGWGRSNPLGIEVGLEGIQYAEVGTNMAGWDFLFVVPAWFAVVYWPFPGLVLVAICEAASLLLRHRYLYLRTITASEAAARRGTAVPHPDALPAVRLSPDLFGKG